MALRLFLVSMVAGMGLSLPTARDLEEWNRKGRAVWVAGLQQWDAMMPTGSRAFAEETRPAPLVIVTQVPDEPTIDLIPLAEDIQFEAIVEVMASRFSEDLQLLVAAINPELIAVVAEAPELELPSDVFAMDQEAALSSTSQADQITPSPTEPARTERVLQAVRLTKEAISAWVGVLGRPVNVVSLRE